MKNSNLFLIVVLFCTSLLSLGQDCDSLHAYTYDEIIQLSELIHDLEAKDSLREECNSDSYYESSYSGVSFEERHGEAFKLGLNHDSIVYLTGLEVISLSNYIFKLEEEDSLRQAKIAQSFVADADEKEEVEENEEVVETKSTGSIVYFEVNSSYVKPDLKENSEVLRSVVAQLSSTPDATYKLEGYTDNSGTAIYNEWLAKRRVERVRAHMISKGISADRLEEQIAHGVSQSLAENDSEESKAQNRSVVITIIE